MSNFFKTQISCLTALVLIFGWIAYPSLAAKKAEPVCETPQGRIPCPD